jgi:hypothetical protein
VPDVHAITRAFGLFCSRSARYDLAELVTRKENPANCKPAPPAPPTQKDPPIRQGLTHHPALARRQDTHHRQSRCLLGQERPHRLQHRHAGGWRLLDAPNLRTAFDRHGIGLQAYRCD